MLSRTPPNRWTLTLLAAAFAVGVAPLADAQQKPKEKKLYCWDEGGHRVCSDALPASAVGRQRTEFDQNTGTAVRHVARALTAEESARAAIEEEAQKIEAQRKRIRFGKEKQHHRSIGRRLRRLMTLNTRIEAQRSGFDSEKEEGANISAVFAARRKRNGVGSF